MQIKGGTPCTGKRGTYYNKNMFKQEKGSANAMGCSPPGAL